MSIALLVITDGRDTIHETIASARVYLRGPITERWIYDDTGHTDHRAMLRSRYPEFTVIRHPMGRQGFGGAIRCAWALLRHHSTADFIFHLEDDFTFNRPAPLDRMAAVLTDTRIQQVALRRQPCNPQEIAAGGVVEVWPDKYVEVRNGGASAVWLEHQLFFTTNPSLYRRGLIDTFDWPEGNGSEATFTSRVLAADDRNVFAYYGSRDSGEWVRHIGAERNGKGY